MKANYEQIKAISTLLGKHNLVDQKDSIIGSFTNGRTTSRKDMTKAEAAALIGHLKSLDPTDRRSDKMRNKILSMAHEMGWNLTPIPATSPLTPLQGERVKSKVDMAHVNNWCVKSGYLHKPLDEYTYNELPRLVSQFEEVYKSYLR
jgi:hypothetical protein